MNTTRDNSPRDPLPCITFTRPRCPYCCGVEFRSRKRIDQGDGAELRYSTCKTCGAHVAIYAE